MKTIEAYTLNRSVDFWTHDAIIQNGVVARINEPVIMTDEKGKEYVPATIVYKQDANGERTFRNRRFTRDLIDYMRDPLKLIKKGMEEFLLFDPKAEILTVGVPLSNAEVISAEVNLENIEKNRPGLGKPIEKLLNQFPEYNFGVIGSMQLGLNDLNSDIDVFVYGGARFLDVVDALKDNDLLSSAGLGRQGEEKVLFHAAKYQKRYGITFDHAREIALRRARYMITTESGEIMKIGINGNHRKGSFESDSILGSAHIGAGRIRGTVFNAEHSCSFPRQYDLQTDSGVQRVASHHWGHQLLVGKGEQVEAVGNRRLTQQGDEVLFLEHEGSSLIYPLTSLS